MEKERNVVVGYRVKRKHVRALNEHVKKFLKSKQYRLYGKRKKAKTIKKCLGCDNESCKLIGCAFPLTGKTKKQ